MTSHIDKKIALFGLSGNPPTGLLGHQGIVRTLVQCGNFDEIWILPVYAHIFSSKRNQLVEFEDRLRMCELSFSQESSESCVVRICTFEKDVAEHYMTIHGSNYRTGTVDLLEYLHQRDSFLQDEAIRKYYFVVGMDSVADMAAGKWKNVERILELAHLAVVERCGCSSDSATLDFIDRFRCMIYFVVPVSTLLGNVSSTVVRSLLIENGPIDSGFLHKDVLAYINTRQLFRK